MDSSRDVIPHTLLSRRTTIPFAASILFIVRFLFIASLAACTWSCAPDDALTPDGSDGPDDPVGPLFQYPLATGTTWLYDYTYDYHTRDTYYETVHGVHTWVVQSGDTNAATLSAHRVDSVQIRERKGPSGAFVETTYVAITDRPFTASTTADSVTVGWLSTLALTQPAFVQQVPRKMTDGGDTIHIAGTWVGAMPYDATYVKGKGLVRYVYSLSAMSATFKHELVLMSVAVP